MVLLQASDMLDRRGPEQCVLGQGIRHATAVGDDRKRSQVNTFPAACCSAEDEA
jgi:hypothetical protein